MKPGCTRPRSLRSLRKFRRGFIPLEPGSSEGFSSLALLALGRLFACCVILWYSFMLLFLVKCQEAAYEMVDICTCFVLSGLLCRG